MFSYDYIYNICPNLTFFTQYFGEILYWGEHIHRVEFDYIDQEYKLKFHEKQPSAGLSLQLWEHFCFVDHVQAKFTRDW